MKRRGRVVAFNAETVIAEATDVNRFKRQTG